MKDYYEKAKVIIEDEMNVIGSVSISEGFLTITNETGKEIVAPLSKCIIKEL